MIGSQVQVKIIFPKLIKINLYPGKSLILKSFI